ncbi:MAG: hypothetical protein PHW25_17580 [Zoogloea sp.]|uniref:hypothetical protein n=1 Tax=Zoogloea sp. TaxID=49181 RepID=UPI002616A663|nr:hypothetical protein [Zoogloea sp.]MDD3328896.1 hypothetical protein [Zoogloea sp.]
MSTETKPVPDWLNATSEAHKRAFDVAAAVPPEVLKGMHESTCVALQVCAFLQEKRFDGSNPAVLEGLFLAIQMMGGPAAAAHLLGYCSVRSA